MSGNLEVMDILNLTNQTAKSLGWSLENELVGHAIPWSVKPDSGNAVENENKIRRETNSNLRIEDKTHYE